MISMFYFLTDVQVLDEFGNDFVVDYYYRVDNNWQYVKMYIVNNSSYLILDYKH